MSGCGEPGCIHGATCRWAPLAAWVRTQGLTPITGAWMDMGDWDGARAYKHTLTRDYIHIDLTTGTTTTADAVARYEEGVLAELEMEQA